MAEEIAWGNEAGEPPTRSSSAQQLALAMREVAAEYPGEFRRVARSHDAQKIASQVQAARAKYGPPEANGWEFRSGREVLANGEKVQSLFIRYDESLIQPGARELHEKRRNEAKASAAKRQATRQKATRRSV
jgi:hypothetical protein